MNMIRDRFITGARTLAALTAVAAVAPAAAHASVAVTKFSLTPSVTQAGASPNITVSTSLATSSGDDPKTVTMNLAAGLLANPVVPATCTQSQLSSNSCPAASQIGSGTVTATILGLSQNNNASLYLVAPNQGEAGRIGMVASTALGNVVAQGPITIRSTPDVGANVTFDNLPKSVGGVSVTVTGMSLTLNGTVNSQAFTRNPTSCAAATTTVTVVPYSNTATSTSASSSFTPSGCSLLAFAPKLSGSAKVNSWTGNTALTTTITQASGQAATKSAALILPKGLSANSSELVNACTTTPVSNCPASSNVGTASVSSPLMAQPLTGRVVLTSSGSMPSVAIVFPAPYALTLVGTSSQNSNGQFVTTFSNMPDLPLSTTTVSLNGGSNALLTGGLGLCFGSQTLSGQFAGQNGASAAVSSALPVSCSTSN
jgi:hypothetical protein